MSQEYYRNIKRIIAETRHVQQIPLLDENQFLRVCRDYKQHLSKQNLYALWKHGLIHADLVESSEVLSIEGIEPIHSSDDTCRYIDNRETPCVKQWKDILSSDSSIPDGLRLYFHRFRYYPLSIILDVFEYKVSPFQYMLHHQGASRLINEYNDKIFPSSGDPLNNRIRNTQNSTILSIFCEPYSYPKIAHKVRYSHPYDNDSIHDEIDERKKLIRQHLESLGLSKIEEMRRDLCTYLEIVDPNKTLHIVLRLMTSRFRDELKGHIGSAMQLFTMAECLRLASENAFDKELPEEDELGFGHWMPNVKQDLFGANRLFDAENHVQKEVLKQYGADYSTTVRCYVEGDTEAGALNSLFIPNTRIDLINLQGNVKEKRGKGIAFRESIRDDAKNHVFSIIMLDADVSDNVRAVRKACEDDEVCGKVYYNDPDLEFGNFTFSELLEVVNSHAIENNLPTIQPSETSIKTGKEFEKYIRKSNPVLGDFIKSQEWGERLMDYALEHPEYPQEHSNSGERNLFQLAQLLIRSVSSFFSYTTTKQKYRIDPITGENIERKETDNKS